MAGIGIEFGRCGFGICADLFPEARLGIVRVFTWRGSLLGRMIEWNVALQAKLAKARDAKE